MQTFLYFPIEKMIDYLTVVYKNYDLLYLQLDNFKKKFSDEEYRLIVVDNTPDSEKKPIKRSDEIDVIVELEWNQENLVGLMPKVSEPSLWILNSCCPFKLARMFC